MVYLSFITVIVITFFFLSYFAILIVSKILSFLQSKFYFVMSELWSVYRLEITVPVGWVLNTNNSITQLTLLTQCHLTKNSQAAFKTLSKGKQLAQHTFHPNRTYRIKSGNTHTFSFISNGRKSPGLIEVSQENNLKGILFELILEGKKKSPQNSLPFWVKAFVVIFTHIKKKSLFFLKRERKQLWMFHETWLSFIVFFQSHSIVLR